MLNSPDSDPFSKDQQHWGIKLCSDQHNDIYKLPPTMLFYVLWTMCAGLLATVAAATSCCCHEVGILQVCRCLQHNYLKTLLSFVNPIRIFGSRP